MESQFSQKNNPSKPIGISNGYGGKIKTGTKKTKLNSPKKKIEKSSPINENKKPGKSKERMDRIPSNTLENNQNTVSKGNKNESIPDWVRESSEKKPVRKEGTESKLQWRKETKKSQRSFSKNKSLLSSGGLSLSRQAGKDLPNNQADSSYHRNDKNDIYKISDEKSRKPFGNTFEKKQPTESTERKSSWDKNSVKPRTGFEKSKTGYKGVGSRWDASTTPIKTTRKWDMPNENKDKETNENKKFPKLDFKKDNTKTEAKKIKYIPPKPTWEKENTKIDKKKLIDPTK